MAKLFATETAAEVAFDAMRILGGNGYSKDFPVERYYRDAPLVVIGGGTNELQRLIIAKNLLKKYRRTWTDGLWPLFRRIRDRPTVFALARPDPKRLRQYLVRLLSMNQHPLWIDEHYARAQGYERAQSRTR